MKTSVIKVRGMLSVLTVDEVEKRIGDVPGVESVTVNYAAGSATVRYDETRLEVADIKSAVRQRGYASTGQSVPRHESEHKPARKRVVEPAPQAVPACASMPETAVPKATTGAPAAAPAPAAPAVGGQDGHEGHTAPDAPPPIAPTAMAKAGRPDDPSVKDADEVATALGADLENGLASQEASHRLAQDGPNELRAAPR